MADAEQAPKDLIGFLDFYLVKKAPFQIPEGGREFIVKFGPWLIVVLLVISLPFILFLLGVGTALLPFGGMDYATGWGIGTILLLAQIGLRVAALPGLFARKMSGWKLLFYSSLVGFLSSLLSVFGIIPGLIGLLISLSILFQVRTKYS